MKNFLSSILLLLAVAAPALVKAQGTWLVKAPIPDSGRRGHSAFTANGKIYIIGGGAYGGGSVAYTTMDVWEYNPGTNSWTPKNDIPFVSRTNPIAITIGNRCFYGMGRANGPGAHTDWWEYLPATDTWVARAPFPDTGRAGSALFVLGGKGYLAGGVGYAPGSSTGYGSNDLWEYDPQTDTWTGRAPIPTGRRHSAMGFALGGNGYMFGGTGQGSGSGFGDMWMYTPSTNSWTQKAAPPNGARYSGAVFAIDTVAYMGLGGWGITFPGQNFDSLFYRYSPAADAWTTITSAPANNRSFASVELGGKGYVIGGAHSSNNLGGLPLCWEFTPSASIPSPTCDTSAILSISSITSTGATLTWSAATGATGYQWVVNTSATPPASGTATASTSQPTTGLTPNTVYRAWLRTVCTNNLFSVWKSRTFSTMPTSVGNTLATAGVVIHPNPARDYLQIELPAAETVTIRNAMGSVVLEASLPKGISDLSISGFAPGLYIIRSSLGTWATRVVKMD